MKIYLRQYKKTELDILIDKKISFIKQRLDIQYSQKEKDGFDLFFGENNLGFKTDEEASKYFKEKIGLQIEFHYFDNKKTK